MRDHEFEFSEDDSELDQLWFDPWEGQIELSNCDSFLCKNDLLLDELDGDPVRVLSPLERRRKSLLRQTSLSVFNQPIYNIPSKKEDFQKTHTLFWNQQHLDAEEGSSSDDVSHAKFQASPAHWSIYILNFPVILDYIIRVSIVTTLP